VLSEEVQVVCLVAATEAWMLHVVLWLVLLVEWLLLLWYGA